MTLPVALRTEQVADCPERSVHTIPVPCGFVGVKATVSFSNESVLALTDGQEGASSGDATVPRLTFWPHRGTEEWICFSWPKEIPLKGIALQWFDDTGRGSCRIPASWRVEVRTADGRGWEPVACETPVVRDVFSRARFPKPIRTRECRVIVHLQPRYSAGVLECVFE